MQNILAPLQDKVCFCSAANRDSQEHTKNKCLTPERKVGTYVLEPSGVPHNLERNTTGWNPGGGHCVLTLQPSTLHFCKGFQIFLIKL